MASATQTATSVGESAAIKAIGVIPVVGPILASIANTVLGIFGSSHAAAVANEAKVINQCLPAWLGTIQNIMMQLSAGAITEADAITAIQGAQSTYYSCVSGIIKKGAQCSGGCLIGGQPANAFPQSPSSIGLGLKTSPNCCNSSTCNAACCIGCSVIEPTTAGLTRIIQAGAGTWVVNPTTQNGLIGSTPALTITYKKPGILETFDRTVLKDFGLSSSITGGSTAFGNIELAAILGVVGIVILFIIVLGHRSAA